MEVPHYCDKRINPDLPYYLSPGQDLWIHNLTHFSYLLNNFINRPLSPTPTREGDLLGLIHTERTTKEICLTIRELLINTGFSDNENWREADITRWCRWWTFNYALDVVMLPGLDINDELISYQNHSYGAYLRPTYTPQTPVK